MSISYVRRQCLGWAFVGPRWINRPLKELRARAKPSASMPLLATCLAEGGGSDQRLARVGPTIGMGVVCVVILQVGLQSGFKFGRARKVAAFEKAPLQDTEPQLHLIEPRTMFGREMENMFVGRITQERAPLNSPQQVFFDEGDVTPLGYELTNFQAPMRVQVVQDPVVALLIRELAPDVGQVGGEIHAGACQAEIPQHLPGRHYERGHQGPCAMANVFLLAFLRFARLRQLRGIFALQNLHAGLFVRADQQTSLLVKTWCVDVQLANLPRLGLEIGVMAVEPIDTAMRFEVGVVQDAPDRRAAHRCGVGLVDNRGSDVIQTPTRSRTVVVSGFTAGYGDDIHLCRGGKSPVADPTAGHLANQRGPVRESGCATGQQYGGRSQLRPRSASWVAGLGRRHARSADNERRGPEEWNWHGSGIPTARVPRRTKPQNARKAWVGVLAARRRSIQERPTRLTQAACFVQAKQNWRGTYEMDI